MNYRPRIQMSTSRWEIFLIITNLLIWIPAIIYYYYNRDNIHDIIIFKSNKPGQAPKDIFFFNNMLTSLFWSAIWIYIFKRTPKSIYPKMENVSKDISLDISKARNQYRVENSFWLIQPLILNLFFSVGSIDWIQEELKRPPFMAHWSWWLVFPLMVLITWLIHHILWSRLADK
jgi:hypothetical protein